MAKILVIGATGVGKSTLAMRLRQRAADQGYTLPLISASGWIVERFSGRAWTSPEERAQQLSEASQALLKADPDLCIRYLRCRAGFDSALIEGVRNPRDFTHVFDPAQDILVQVGSMHSGTTPFEQYGLRAIQAYGGFLLSTGLMDKSRLIEFQARSSNENSRLVAQIVADWWKLNNT